MIDCGILVDYLRMVSYGVVFLTSLLFFKQKKYSLILLVGDALMAVMLLSSSTIRIINIDYNAIFLDVVWTPVVTLWAFMHLWIFVKKT